MSKSLAVNTRSILGSRFCGRSRTGIESICSMLDFPPPISGNTYASHTKNLCGLLGEVAHEQQKAVASNLKHARG